MKSSLAEVRQFLCEQGVELDAIYERIALTHLPPETTNNFEAYAAELATWRDKTSMVLAEYYDVAEKPDLANIAEGDIETRECFIANQMKMLQAASREAIGEKYPKMAAEAIDDKILLTKEKECALGKGPTLWSTWLANSTVDKGKQRGG